jgi:replicative DNA helicase
MKKKVLYQTELEYADQMEVERIVLGSLLVNSEAIYEIVGELDAKYFQSIEHNLIVSALLRLHINNSPIDLVTIVEQLIKEQNLQKVGGAKYLSSITERIGSTAHLQYHFRILQQYWLARFISQTCSEAQLDILTYKKDIFEEFC